MKYLGVLALIVGISIAFIYHSRDQSEDEDLSLIQNASLRLVVSVDEGSRFGSAIIFDASDTHYYALTNEHVLRDASRVQAIDYLQNSYEAELIEDGMHVSYDLGIIKIDRINELSVLSLASSSSSKVSVRSIGYPNSIFSITSGEITSIEGIEHVVTFPVIHHSAFIEMGSSGGALIDTNNRIVGINFAVYHDSSGYVESYAIPVERVQAFLDTVSYR